MFQQFLTTSPSTNVRTRSPISGDISDPNCCRVVRNLFSLLSCLAPHAGGNCWLAFTNDDGEDRPFKPRGECKPFIFIPETK